MSDKKYAEKLIKEYSDNDTEVSKLDELKSLDSKVKVPALVFTYVFGTIGSLILGLGMCLAMQIIGKTIPLMIVGIVIGLVGIAMVAINYPLYQKILASRKKKYAELIISKSNELLNK